MSQGNTKQVEKARLKNLIPTQKLKTNSLLKSCFTRHLANTAMILPKSEYTLLLFISYMTDQACSFTYSTKLLEQYHKANERIRAIAGIDKVDYLHSPKWSRMSFISLVEKGYFIRIKGKNNFLINPFVIYSGNYRIISGNAIQKRYMEIMDSADVEGELTKYCDEIKDKFNKENNRTSTREK